MEYQSTISREFLQDLYSLPPAISRKAVRTTARMIADPWAQEFHPEKVRRAEPGIHSSRVDDDYRLIWKHVKPNHVILCLVDKHDEAYRRAVRKSFTLADGIVRVADIVEVGAKKTESRDQGIFGWMRAQKDTVGLLFAGYRDQELIDMGVPKDILTNVRALEDVNQMELIERLLDEDVYNRLLEIALGIVERPVVPDKNLSESLVRHRGGDELHMLVNSEEFQRVLNGDMEEWMLFLAPHQQRLVTRTYAGPARVKGVAGSGKTVVAIHRARHLAQIIYNEQKPSTETQDKVLFLTFGNRLPNVLRHLLQRLAGPDAPELGLIECCTLHQWCARLLRENGRTPNVDQAELGKILQPALAAGHRAYPQLTALWNHPPRFFSDEIRYAIKGRAVPDLNAYLDLERSGRGTALGETERCAMWTVYEVYQNRLREQNLWDWDDFILEALRLVQKGALAKPFRAAVVDEIQDLTEATMKLVRAIVQPGANDLFLVGDGLQRLYPGGYVLSRMGIDITGRGTVLRRNYRNTQEILRAAFAMMSDLQFNDLDDQESPVEEPEYSPRSGPVPILRGFRTPEEELQWVASHIQELKAQDGYQDGDFAILFRQRYPYEDLSAQQLGASFPLVELTRDPSTYFGQRLKYSTFDSAKGLEFKVVFVMGVTDGQFVPRDDWTLQGTELDDYLTRERSRLFVAMTRARDRLFLSYARGRPSRFLANVPERYLARV
jgi:superfamily I DNA/RNA helicase/mRNA-degrading endonuclease RelE of RelBE toxin-antitoxin system